MARLYHSASSLASGDRCEVDWGLSYIDKLRPPEVTWEEYELAPHNYASRQRSLALGKEVDARLGAWYAGGEPEWSDLPGQIAHTGTLYLPSPGEGEFSSQLELGDIECETRHGVKQLIEIDGVRFAGGVDLDVYMTDRKAARQLGLPLREHVIHDYKTSGNIGAYALTKETLPHDLQANLYAYAGCMRYGYDRIRLRWVYMHTRKRLAVAVNARISRVAALRFLRSPVPLRPPGLRQRGAPRMSWLELAHHLDAIETTAEAVPNDRACGEYAGCQRHCTNGGPCEVVRSIGALIRINEKGKSKDMPMQRKSQEETRSSFRASLAERESAEDDKPRGKKKASKKTSGKKASKKRSSKPSEVGGDTPADTVLSLAGELSDAKEAATAAQADFDEVEATYTDAAEAREQALAKVTEANEAVTGLLAQIKDATS